jgi:hypothetical protein
MNHSVRLVCSSKNSIINAVGCFSVKTTKLFSASGSVIGQNFSEAVLNIALRDSGALVPARVAAVTPDGNHVSIAMDTGCMTLHEFINLTPWEVRMVVLPDIFFNLVEAVSRLHARSIAHLDIKPENIIVERNSTGIRLIDLGGGRYLLRGCPARVNGTPQYMAPEALAGGPATFACDSWSLGATLFAYIFKREVTKPLPTDCPAGCPRMVFNAMIRMLEPCAADRLCVHKLYTLLGTEGPVPPPLIKDVTVPVPLDAVTALARIHVVDWLFVYTRFVGAAPLAVSIYDRYGRGHETPAPHIIACAELACAILYPDYPVTVPVAVRRAMVNIVTALRFDVYADTCEWVLALHHGIDRPDMWLVNCAIKEACGSTTRAVDLYLEMAKKKL